MKLVEKHSACLDCHDHFALDVRHAMMNKFRGPQDGSFQLVSGRIKELFDNAHIIESRTAEERKCIQLLTSNLTYRKDKDRNAERVPGTCQWFIGHSKFLNWRDDETASLLWVSADPGCGKSVLSRALVDERLLSADSTMPSICYFFFKDDSGDLQSISNALCAILHQLFIQKPALLKHAMPDFENYGGELCKMFDTLWDILKEAAADLEAGQIICLLDALDECKESARKDLIAKLSNLHSTQTETYTKLKFLVTSRPYSDIERAFRKNTKDMSSISLKGEEESEKISKEINRVIEDQIPRISGTFEYPLKLEVQKALVEHLKSMKNRTYLWLHLVLDVIRETQESTKDRLKTLIDTIPESVDKAYERILNKIKNRDWVMARRLFHIIVVAAAPLTLREMNIALAIEEKLEKGEICQSIDHLVLDDENPFKTKVRNLCGLFVSVIDSKVYLTHQTVKEFLVSKKDTVQPYSPGMWKHSLEPRESNLALAKICISYLLFTEFESDPLVRDDRASLGEIDRYTNKHNFLDYSAKYWANHFREARVKEMAILESALEVCNTRSKRFQTWFQVYCKSSYFHCPLSGTNLMVGSYFGLEAVVKLLLAKDGVDPDPNDNWGRTPLSWAAENGHEAVVKLLLAKDGVDPDPNDNRGRTPLSWAAGNGHEAVVKLLLAKDEVDPDSKDDVYGQTPLSWAAGDGHEAVVKLLLAKDGVDLDSKDERYGRTPLSWAAGNGHEAVVKLLLAKDGVDPDPKDKRGQTPLWRAAENGHEAVVKLLLAKDGVDPDSKDVRGRTETVIAGGRERGERTGAKRWSSCCSRRTESTRTLRMSGGDRRRCRGRRRTGARRWSSCCSRRTESTRTLRMSGTDRRRCRGRQGTGTRRWSSCCNRATAYLYNLHFLLNLLPTHHLLLAFLYILEVENRRPWKVGKLLSNSCYGGENT